LHKLLFTLAETIATTKVRLDGLNQLARSPRCQRPAVQVAKRQKSQLAAIREMSVRVSARYRHIIGRQFFKLLRRFHGHLRDALSFLAVYTRLSVVTAIRGGFGLVSTPLIGVALDIITRRRQDVPLRWCF
jgi:hypothetical protein